MVRKLVFVLVAGSIALSATACNTMRGAGKDIQSAANEVDKKT